MDLARALGEVLASVEAGMGRAVFSYDTVAAWDAEVLETIIAHDLLKPTAVAQSIECRGCEERCFSDVVVQPSEAGAVRAYVVCEVPAKQAQMGRVSVQPERLSQWLCSADLLARFITDHLGLANVFSTGEDPQRIRLGMLKGINGRRWVSLIAAPLTLEVNQHIVPVSELLFIEEGVITLDKARIRSLLDVATEPARKAYTLNTDQREARQLATQAMYQEWQDAYDSLRHKHPGKSKKWCSIKLARMPVARDRDAETIRKRLR